MRRFLIAVLLVLIVTLPLVGQTTTTLNLKMAKPRQGSTSWGAVINGNFDTLDSFLSGSSILPWIQIHRVTLLDDPTVDADAISRGYLTNALATATVDTATHAPWSGLTGVPETFMPPLPTVSTLGGVMAKTCSGTDKLSAIGTDGVPVCSGDQTGAGGTGITSLNGATGSTQTFATGTTGTAPAWSTNTGTGQHTFNLPSAATSGVTAGTVPNDRYGKWNTRAIVFVVGADSGTTLDSTWSQTSLWANQLGAGVHITKVWCESDSGSPVMNLQRDDGSPANVLGANLTCSSSGASSTTFASGEDAVADGQRLDFVLVNNDTAKRITVAVRYTLD